MISLDVKGKWVLVTGASSGLGKEMAEQLCRDYQANVLIVARREERLVQLKAELESKYPIQVRYMVADLANPQDVAHLLQLVTTEINLTGAILNAGVTYFGKNTEITTAQFESIIDTNIKSVVTLCNGLINHYRKTSTDFGLMIVSSMAAFFPAPYQTIYSASKAFIMTYATAFAKELDNKKVSISVFAPGGIQTEMTAGESFAGLQKWLMPVDKAAHDAIHTLLKRKFIFIPGWSNRIGARFMRLLPRTFLIGQMAKVYKKSLDKLEDKNS